jgi:hypothetical protein
MKWAVMPRNNSKSLNGKNIKGENIEILKEGGEGVPEKANLVV